MVLKTRKPKRAQPAPEQPIVWERADPAALANFDSSTKTCTMNCGPHGLDPRSREERLFLCDDCDCHEPKGPPAMSARLKTAELSQFSHGVLYAAAEVQRLHDEPQVAADLLKSAGLAQVDCSSLDEYDKEPLREVNKIRGMGLTGLGEAPDEE